MYTKLCELRKAKGLTQLQVAQAAGISFSTVSLYESGQRKLPVEVAQKISPLLGCEWPELYEPTNPAS